ncbi:hypothetical protein PspLS_10191 [Pyricularia sp. CBS 133598]|nr:hypothetical protein PspLS_10191 [Pyricularia sp. CBS 133598]
MSASHCTSRSIPCLSQLVGNPEIQVAETIYERLSRSNSDTDTRVLAPYYELNFANDFAYLACTEEGARKISATCLEEGRNGLKILVASNELPSAKTIASLQNIGNAISSYASHEIHRHAFLERSFDLVMQLTSDRIIQRVRPVWSPEPSWHRKWTTKDKGNTKTSLLERLQQHSPLIGSEFEHRFPKTTSALKNLLEQLQKLENEGNDNKAARLRIRIIITKAYEVSTAEMPRTLEAKLRECSMADLAGRKEIRQVDKLARYYGICRNFAKIARREGHRRLLSNILVARCEGYSTVSSRPGNTLGLHVHAEVQLTMHYLARSPSPAPRAMGCSKSACFLCHALITRLAQFSVSACHGKLYPKWNIPGGVRLESKKSEQLDNALREINEEVSALIKAPAARVACPPESRALSLLSGASTATQLSSDSGSEVSSAETIRPSSVAGPSANTVSKLHSSLAELQKELLPLSSKATPASSEAGSQAKSPADNNIAGPRGDQSPQAAAPTEGTRDSSPDATTAVQQPDCNKPNDITAKPLSIRESPVAQIRLRKTDLPYERRICNDMPLLDLRLGPLALSLDFSSISVGRLSVTRGNSTDTSKSGSSSNRGGGGTGNNGSGITFSGGNSANNSTRSGSSTVVNGSSTTARSSTTDPYNSSN